MARPVIYTILGTAITIHCIYSLLNLPEGHTKAYQSGYKMGIMMTLLVGIGLLFSAFRAFKKLRNNRGGQPEHLPGDDF